MASGVYAAAMVANIFQKAYRLGLSNPNLSAVIANMVDERQMEKSLAVIGQPDPSRKGLAAAEWPAVD